MLRIWLQTIDYIRVRLKRSMTITRRSGPYVDVAAVASTNDPFIINSQERNSLYGISIPVPCTSSKVELTSVRIDFY
jgi:hypothetical protein